MHHAMLVHLCAPHSQTSQEQCGEALRERIIPCSGIRFLCGFGACECNAASVTASVELSCHLSSPLYLTTVVLLIPHQLQLSSSLRFTLAPRSSRQRTAQVTQLLTDLSCIDRQSREDPGRRPSTVTPLSFSLLSPWSVAPRATPTTSIVFAPTLLARATDAAPPVRTSSPAHTTSESWATLNARRVCRLVRFTLTSLLTLQRVTGTSTTPLTLPLLQTRLPLPLPRHLHRRLTHQPLLLRTPQSAPAPAPHSLIRRVSHLPDPHNLPHPRELHSLFQPQEPHSLLQRRTFLPSPPPSMH
jgi:hypothetical protein